MKRERIFRRFIGPPVWSLILIVCGAFSAACALAQTIPPKPVIADIPKLDWNGQPVRGLRFRATTATRLVDGMTFVMFGFAVAKFDRSARFFLWNRDLDAYCYGGTRLGNGGQGIGNMICLQGETEVSRQEIIIPSGSYGRLAGTTRYHGTDPQGQGTTTILRWTTGARFPDPAPLLEMLKRTQ